MAEIWGAAIAATAVVGGAIISSNGAKSAANAAAQGAQNAAQEQGREFDIVQQQYAPQRQLGIGAMGLLAQLYGIPNPSGAGDPSAAPPRNGISVPMLGAYGGGSNGSFVYPNGKPATQGAFSLADGGYAITNPKGGGLTAPNASGPGAKLAAGGPTAPANGGSPDYSAFFNSPGYKFTLSQGENAIDRSAAASGGLYSTGTLGALNSYAQGQAGTQYNNYVQQLLALAGLGGQAASGVSSAAVATGQGVANSMISAGNANASGVLGSANAFGNAIGQGGNMLSNYFNNNSTYSPGYATNGGYVYNGVTQNGGQGGGIGNIVGDF